MGTVACLTESMPQRERQTERERQRQTETETETHIRLIYPDLMSY